LAAGARYSKAGATPAQPSGRAPPRPSPSVWLPTTSCSPTPAPRTSTCFASVTEPAGWWLTPRPGRCPHSSHGSPPRDSAAVRSPSTNCTESDAGPPARCAQRRPPSERASPTHSPTCRRRYHSGCDYPKRRVWAPNTERRQKPAAVPEICETSEIGIAARYAPADAPGSACPGRSRRRGSGARLRRPRRSSARVVTASWPAGAGPWLSWTTDTAGHTPTNSRTMTMRRRPREERSAFRL